MGFSHLKLCWNWPHGCNKVLGNCVSIKQKYGSCGSSRYADIIVQNKGQNKELVHKDILAIVDISIVNAWNLYWRDFLQYVKPRRQMLCLMKFSIALYPLICAYKLVIVNLVVHQNVLAVIKIEIARVSVHLFQLVSGQLSPGKIVPRIIVPPDNCSRENCPPDNYPRTIAPEDNCPQGITPHG